MYGKLENNELIYASRVAIINGDMIITNPQEEDYINAGYKPIIDNVQLDAENEYTPIYTEEEDKIIINYEVINEH